MLLDYGSTFGPGTVTHNLVAVSPPSGALVFGAGTVQWSWGLDVVHDRGSAPRPTCACSRRPSTCSPTWACSPATLQVAASSPPTPSTDLLAADLDDHLAGRRRLVRRRHADHDHRHRDRVGRRPGRRRRSVDRRRRDLDARDRHDELVVQLDGERHRNRRRSRAARYDDSGNMETPSGGVSITIAAVRPARARIWSADDGAAGAGRRRRSGVGRARHEVPLRRRRLHHRRPLLQGRRQHRHPHRHAVDAAPARCSATVTFTGETASGWQQVNFAERRSPITANTTYVVSYHAPNGHYTGTDTFFATARRQPAAARAEERHGRRERRLSLRRGDGVPEQHLQLPRTTGSTSSSPPRRRPTRRRRP